MKVIIIKSKFMLIIAAWLEIRESCNGNAQIQYHQFYGQRYPLNIMGTDRMKLPHYSSPPRASSSITIEQPTVQSTQLDAQLTIGTTAQCLAALQVTPRTKSTSKQP